MHALPPFKYTTSPHFRACGQFEQAYVGTSVRFAEMKRKEWINNDFVQWCRDDFGIQIPENEWRFPEYSLKTSYEQCARFWNSVSVQPLDKHVRDKAFRFVVRHYSFFMRESGVIPLQEALSKCPEGTSTGFPLNRVYADKGAAKRDPLVIRKFMRWMKSLFSDNPIPDVFLNQMKDELREFGKAVRTFMPGPMFLHVLMVMLFYQQNRAICANFDHLWTAVGISPFHGGWQRLYDEMVRSGDQYFESDISG